MAFGEKNFVNLGLSATVINSVKSYLENTNLTFPFST
jgi:hypothetical protein